MKKNIIIFLAGFLLLVVAFEGHAQQRSRGGGKRLSAKQKFMEQSPFFHQQWWVGIKGGLTAGNAVPMDRYSVFQGTGNAGGAGFEKEYLDFQWGSPATTIGLTGTYTFWKSLSVSLQPSHTSLKFGYKTSYSWEGEGMNTVTINQTHQLKVSYFEVPLLFRYDIYKAKTRPYVQGGVFYGRMLKADKNMETESFDAASGAAGTISGHTPVIGAGNLFINTNIGWQAGGGINYDLGSIRLGLEVNYKQGFQNVTDRKNRFADQRMTGTGDVLDDMKLRSWETAFTLQFPLKFLDTGSFQPAKP